MPLDAPPSPALTAPQPNPPVRQYSFTDFQVNNPSAPPPGDRLDGEYDRTNAALQATIDWAATSLNSDGTLKPQSVGRSELQLGLFDEIWADGEARVRVLAEAAEIQANAAVAAAYEADASALAAGGQNERVQEAAGRAEIEAQDAAADAASAAQSAAEAAASATSASNSANHADGSEAVCTDYGVLTQAWAEHMPDTIPPNILAVMDVTGDHWSSRWWANRAHEIVEEDTANAICDLQHYWMGAYPAPPVVNNCGEPVVAGAMYFNTTEKVTQVYDGVEWHDVTQPVPGQIDEYLYLPATPTTVFSGVDYRGNTLTLDPVSAEIAVYLNGVKLLEDLDYSVAPSAITMLLGPVPAPNTVEIMSVNDTTLRPPAQGVKVNTTPWVFNGVAVTFPLADSVGTVLDPPGSVDCLVSLNGVMQEAGVDFTVNPGFITFTTAPEADADRWMVVGIPLGGEPGGGSGDVVGPASATDEALVRFDGTTGKLVQTSPVGPWVTDAGEMYLNVQTAVRKRLQFGADANDPLIQNSTTGGGHLRIRSNGTSTYMLALEAASDNIRAGTGVSATTYTEFNSTPSAGGSLYLSDGTTRLAGITLLQHSADAALAFPGRPGTDELKRDLHITGAAARTTATVNLNGGNIRIQPGNGASGSAGSAGGGTLYLNGGRGYGTGNHGRVTVGASYGYLNLPHTTAPATPVNGDVWTQTDGLYVRINGVTRKVTVV